MTSASFFGTSKKSSSSRQGSHYITATTFALTLLIVQAANLLIGSYFIFPKRAHSGPSLSSSSSSALTSPPFDGPILISYSYFEKDPIQTANFDFFITLGMGIGNTQLDNPFLSKDMDFTIVINGDICTPCARLASLVNEEPSSPLPAVSQVYSSPNGGQLSILKRIENEGMDFAAHNTTMELHKARGTFSKYKYFIFLNSSIRGPFMPSYMPTNWLWPMAYLIKLRGDVHAVSSSIVCLPEVDEGGPGPRLESWAFATDVVGLQALITEDVFELRTCKLCKDGIVVKGEYGLTTALFKHGHNIDTLMSKYGSLDWRNQNREWHCNNNAHPSRHGSYDGISMHPFETVFIKSSWHVGEPFVDKYTRWFVEQATGGDTAAGSFDEAMYRYAISMKAQMSHNVEKCYQVLE